MKKYISIILTILAVAGSSCKKNYLDELAINPNTPAVTTPALTLAGALKTTADIVAPNASTVGLNAAVGGFIEFGCWDGFLAWSTGTQPSATILLYQVTTSSYDYFTPIYSNISNYNAVIGSTTEPNYIAISKIMEVYDFEMLVDVYNDVPYFQAVQGITNLTPKYDSASAIYDDLMKQLDAAIVLIANAPTTAAIPGKADIVYGGTGAAEMTNWKLFANTLKLRLAIRQTNVTAKAAALKTAIQATAALGYISSTANEANVQPGYLNINGQQSPLDQTLGYTQTGGTSGVGATYYANAYVVNYMIGGGTPLAPDDPRLFQEYAPSPTVIANGKVEATQLGQTSTPTEIDPATGKATGVLQSRLSNFLLAPTKSTPIFSAAESLFLQAEAAKNGLIAGTPATLYNAGITASYVDLGLTAGQAAIYYSMPAYAYPAGGSDAQQVQAIVTQKWLSLNPFGYLEAYNEMRRTGYPAVPVSILTGVATAVQPSRIPYPLIEYNTNAVNVGAEGNPDLFTSKIFWAK
jgi:hypothetical protein